MMNIHYLWMAVGIVLCNAIPGLANPGSRDLHAVLAVHGLCQGGADLRTQAEGLWKEHGPKVPEIEKLHAEKKLDSLKPKELQAIYQAGREMNRLAIYLKEMGEPAGVDVAMRAEYLDKVSHAAALDYSHGTKSGAQLLEKIFQRLTKEIPKMKQLSQRLQETANRGSLVEAEAGYNKAMDDLYQDMVFIAPSKRVPYIRIFDPLRPVLNARAEERKAQNVAQLTNVLKSQVPNIDQLAQAVAAAAQTLQSAETCQVGTSACSGPEAFVKLFQQWQLAHVQIVRCEAIAWALRSLESNAGLDCRKIADTLSSQMVQSLPQLILADAARMNGKDTSALYAQYMKAIGPLLQTSVNKPLTANCDTALAKLSAVNPNLEAAVSSYEKATDDLLFWRQQLASKLAGVQAKDFPELTPQFREASRSADGYIGLFKPVKATQTDATLATFAPATVQVPVRRLMDQQVSVDSLIRLPGNSKFIMSTYGDRNYANVLANVDVSAQLASLESDLMVSDNQPPLSLAAASAIESAKRMDLVRAGGVVKGYHLEGVISRVASLPNNAFVMVPINLLAGQGEPEDLALDQMMVRFDVLPAWVQHRYFFVAMPGNGSNN